MKKKNDDQHPSKKPALTGKHDPRFEGDRYGHGNNRQYENESEEYNRTDNYNWGKKEENKFTPYKNKGRAEFAARTRTRKSRFD